MLLWPGAHGADVVDAAPDAPPIVICPGFGNCTADYAAPFGIEENGIEAALKVWLSLRLCLDTYLRKRFTHSYNILSRRAFKYPYNFLNVERLLLSISL